jgi:citrate lyase subunit beta/citryl-CoA lyase
MKVVDTPTGTLPARSYLFVPGNRPERFVKAYESGADVVILDLEDAVADLEKEAAREAVRHWLTTERPVYLRINSDPENQALDLELLQLPGVTGVVVPKADDPEAIAGLLRAAPAGLQVIALVETARGIVQSMALASIHGVSRLAFGSVDFRLELGLGDGRDELLMARSQLVLASRAAGLPPPVDAPTLALDDPVTLADDVAYARRLGFGGKLCIHPRQIAVVNTGFRDTPEEVAWARRVVDAAQSAAGNAVRVDDRLVDQPIFEHARAVLRRAGASSG